MARKNFVLDTNVIIYDPEAVFKFEENNVILPIYVIEEIDRFKGELSERGRNAREVARILDSLRENGSLHSGIQTEAGGIIRVQQEWAEVPNIGKSLADSRILGVALHVHNSDLSIQTTLVTKDINLRVRADAIGVRTEDYTADKVEIDDLYCGTREVDTSSEIIDSLYDQKSIPFDGCAPNEFVMLRNGSHTGLGRYRKDGLHKLPTFKDGVWGIKPRNREQHYALDLLMDDNVKLVSLIGKAGTGKTLLAIAAGLQKVIDEGRYQRLLVSRPIFPLGKDIGYLPGTVEDKLNPWMQPIYDNVELLLNFSKEDKKRGRNHRELFDLGWLEIEPLTYIRGRSIPNQFLIVDEAQNLTPHEVKTIVTRAGDGTKIVLTGDPYQIDNPYVDAESNGLSTVVEKFKGYDIAGHVSLIKGERSDLAELATHVL